MSLVMKNTMAKMTNRVSHSLLYLQYLAIFANCPRQQHQPSLTYVTESE